VTSGDIAAWHMGLRDITNVTIETIPKSKTLLISGTGKPGPAEYSVHGHVAPVVIRILASFIKAQSSLL
jgi:uncharacterized protein